MPKPTCVKCLKFLRPKENGVFLIEQAPDFNSEKPNDDDWRPYKIWAADLWACKTEGCDNQLLTGYGRTPKQRHEEGFERELEWAKKHTHFIVNDC
jgi:hypothetical protein